MDLILFYVLCGGICIYAVTQFIIPVCTILEAYRINVPDPYPFFRSLKKKLHLRTA